MCPWRRLDGSIVECSLIAALDLFVNARSENAVAARESVQSLAGTRLPHSVWSGGRQAPPKRAYALGGYWPAA